MQAAEDLGAQMVKIAEKKFAVSEDVQASHIGYGTTTW